MKVIITEYGYNSLADTHWGPTEYTFDFTGSKFPDLRGTSNGATHVAISNPKK